MSDYNFWLWTLLFTLISFFIIRAFCCTRCYMTDKERLYYTRLSKPLSKKPVTLYSINSHPINKIDNENV